MSITVFTLPNVITSIRILLIPAFVIAILYGSYPEAAVFFIAASVSDAVDGWIARTWNQRSELGVFLDPAADKCLMIASFVLFASFGWVPLWLALTLIGRDLVIVLGWVFIMKVHGLTKVSPTMAGKTAIASEMVLLSYILLWLNIPSLPEPMVWMFVVVAVLSVASGLQYIYRGLEQTREKR
ncbi:MAG: CDP-diacylglycerol--glycerol-3-phosphate 3-phosphatidyltransferase [Nitrospirae bacterium]|nr:MAG: CDP-diacylglycerol--glycerol-3-phosphate 3-phosphatidyltransferase [Nitrospirota bacterium]